MAKKPVVLIAKRVRYGGGAAAAALAAYARAAYFSNDPI